MMIYIFTINLLMSLIFMFLNHPLSLGCVLLIQTISISLLSGMMFKNFWFSYILFLIMIGGMLVLFIYMTSIASNEKFYMSKKILLYYLTSMLLLLLLLLLDKFYFNFLLNNQLKLYINMSLNKFFNLPSSKISLLLIIYLFITLIAIVKITGKSSGPLRQK